MKLKEGDWVRLRNGEIRGPLRDRANENDIWPWGEKCEKCGSSSHNSRYWFPDGTGDSDDPHHMGPSPYDIVEVIHRPNPLDALMQGLPTQDPYGDGDLAHWIASPMKDVGTSEQFHQVVDRAQRVLNYWRLRDQAHKINQEQKPSEFIED